MAATIPSSLACLGPPACDARSDGRWIPTRASLLMVLSIAPINKKTQAAGSPRANRDRRSLCPHDPTDLEGREDLATLAVDVDMEVHFPMQRVPDGIAALERVSNQLEPGSVDDAAELHREGACCHLRCSLATTLAALELLPPRGT